MSPAPTAQYTAVTLGHGHQRFPISIPVKYIVGKVAGEGVISRPLDGWRVSPGSNWSTE